MQKLLQYFAGITEQDTPQTMEELLQKYMPYGELEKVQDVDTLLGAILSGKPALFIDGFSGELPVDPRTGLWKLWHLILLLSAAVSAPRSLPLR